MKHEILAPGIEIYCADCLDVMRDMPDKSVDAIITDLPYEMTSCLWDETIPFELMWEQVKRVCVDVFATTGSQPFTSKLVMSNLEMFKYELIWNKKLCGNFLNANYQPLKIHENILVFSQKATSFTKNGDRSNYNPQTISKPFRQGSISKKPAITHQHKEYIYKSVSSNKKNPVSILEFSNAERKSVHPTQKPVSLYTYLIMTYTNKNDIVMDFCFGSGTTGVACVQTGRRFIGIEIDPDYYEIAKKRIKEALMQPRLL